MERDTIVARTLQKPTDLTDAETGLHRENYFNAIFAAEMRRIRRTSEPLTIGILGVGAASVGDGGSPIPAPERDSAELGTCIRRNIREIDIATRCGTGLYTLLLGRTGAQSAHVAGERIRTRVEEWFKQKTTVTIGLASFPEDGLDEEAIVGRAVDAYLHAVAAGGNRVFFFERPKRRLTGSKPRILVVDDEVQILKLLSAQLAPQGFELLTATSGEQALELARGIDIDLVILDVLMPGMNGFEVCRRIKGNEATRLLPVILLTALQDSESRLKGIKAGADDFISKPANREELFARTRSLIRVKRMNRDLISLENALISLANAVEAKDNYTLGHTQRVSTLAVSLGSGMGLDEVDLQALRLGGILHDVGKIGVPEYVLNKPGPLSQEEWEIMRSHPELGHKICLPLIESIGSALDVIRHHHEKLDGSSYPDGLKESSISLVARIMTVVDCYDAMITDRPYRAGMAKEKALTILREEARRGLLDGQVVGALERLVTVRPSD